MPGRMPVIHGKLSDIMPVRRSKRLSTRARVRNANEASKKAHLRLIATAAARQGRSDKGAPRSASVALKFVNPDGSVAVDVVARGLGITRASLAASIGLAEETLQRSTRSRAPKTQQRLREMLEILARVEPWAGSLAQALGWYRGQGIPALGHQTAEALVKNGQAAIVREYLDGLAAGAFA
jgi:hypothetical protein